MPNGTKPGDIYKLQILAAPTLRIPPGGDLREKCLPESRTVLFTVRLDKTIATESLVLEAFKE